MPTHLSKESHGALYSHMEKKLLQGQDQQDSLVAKVQAMHIVDSLVHPKKMTFVESEGKLLIAYEGLSGASRIHRHALSQLAQKVELPISYVKALLVPSEGDWRLALLANNLNENYRNLEFPDKDGNPRFLHRTVNGELRGFLSRRFNRRLASIPLLAAFVGACQEMYAVPFEALATDVKVSLKCFLPMIFEPVTDQPIAIGVEWANSEFGQGKMTVGLSIWQPVHDRFGTLDETLSRVHLGSVIEDAEIDLSEDTYKKEVETQQSAIRDAVKGQLSIENIDRILSATAEANKQQIPWQKLKGQLARFLSKGEVEDLKKMLDDEGVIPLPPLETVDSARIPTAWWASSALSWLASKEASPERRFELQHFAGSFLGSK